mmetsp:Transcript_32065/g.54695  ORF Transcript_32065/g.54695 Transcript_32065/m.54695 type:complete len:99 (+) Transcript_32065:4445-4741(+)|eukprot:scaffold16710_cov80-Skeletonema_marinoi.AAC.1
MLQQTKTTLDIVGMDDKVVVRVTNAKIPDAAEEERRDSTVVALQFAAFRRACHHIDGTGILRRALPCVKDASGRFARMEKDVLRSQEHCPAVASDPAG